MPASTSLSLVMKLLDSPYRPPAFVKGPQSSSWVVDGQCAPSYVEVRLAPLGAYRLLGLPPEEPNGQLIDLVEVLGGGRRLAAQLRETPTWRQRFTLVDRFQWRRLDQSGRRPGWADLAREAGSADQAHLIRRKL